MGNKNEVLASRSIIKHGKFALIAPEGLVTNVIPGFENCDVTILASPKLGASFVDYLVTMNKGGKNATGFGGDSYVETFVYVLEGKVKATAENEEFVLGESGYLYCPPNKKMYLENLQENASKLFLYKQKYKPLEGHHPWVVSGHASEIEGRMNDAGNVHFKALLPTDLAFDLSFNILTFDSTGSHSFVETHVQEHGAYLLSGAGVYNLDNEWIPVKKDDYIFMGPYVPQATYAVGKENLSYLYSKDCNRDADL